MNKRQRKKTRRFSSLWKDFRDWKRGKTRWRITYIGKDGVRVHAFETYQESKARILARQENP